MSGRRKELLVKGEIYHAFNRSIASEPVFGNDRLLQHASEIFKFYIYPQKLRYSFYSRLPFEAKKDYFDSFKKQNKIVDVYAFAFMPTHFHFLLKQNVDGGIKIFLSYFQNSHAKYYNLITKRSGSVFQKPFKAKRIKTDPELLHVGRYIHLNPVTSFLINLDELSEYPWNSFQYLVKDTSEDIIDIDKTLKLVGSKSKYKKFVDDQSDYQRRLSAIRHLMTD